MSEFEIIVKNEENALRLKLPKSVVDRIKQLSSLNKKEFNDSDIKTILKMIIQSLDSLLYGFDGMNSHEETETETEVGKVLTEKKKHGGGKKR